MHTSGMQSFRYQPVFHKGIRSAIRDKRRVPNQSRYLLFTEITIYSRASAALVFFRPLRYWNEPAAGPGGTWMGLWAPRADLNFLSLQRAVFSIECELIHENNTPTCHACGSQAVLSLSRVMGG